MLDFRQSTVTNADLRHVDLRPSERDGEPGWPVTLIDANLSGADLSGAYLNEAHLGRAKLIKAKLIEANLMKVKLDGADLTGADLTAARLTEAVYDKATRWPNGFDPQAAGAILQE